MIIVDYQIRSDQILLHIGCLHHIVIIPKAAIMMSVNIYMVAYYRLNVSLVFEIRLIVLF